MKFLLFVLICFLEITGCSSPSYDFSESKLEKWLKNQEKIRVLSTIEMINDLVIQVGGDYIAAITLITGQLDPHSYQLVKGDDEKLAAADLIFFNGLGLEHGPSLQHQLYESKNSISLGDSLREKDPSAIWVENGQVDPHIWMDISLWAQTVDTIATALSSKDPAHSSYFVERAESLKARMEMVNRKVKELLQAIPETKRYLVTSHDAFNYFARAYLATDAERENGFWRNRVAAPEGLAPEGQISARDIREIINYMALHKVSVLFPESNVSRDSIKKIVNAGRGSDLKLTIADRPLYADAMGKIGSEADTYLKMVEYDAELIASYLNL